MMANGCNFVLVDDDAVVLMLMESVLKAAFPDCRIVEFCNARNALLYILQRQPDAVITDYNMGEMSGLDLIQRLREAGMNNPIIMVSNHPLIRKKAVTAGATAFIDKIDIAERLVETVKDTLSPPVPSTSVIRENYFAPPSGETAERSRGNDTQSSGP